MIDTKYWKDAKPANQIKDSFFDDKYKTNARTALHLLKELKRLQHINMKSYIDNQHKAMNDKNEVEKLRAATICFSSDKGHGINLKLVNWIRYNYLYHQTITINEFKNKSKEIRKELF